MNIGIEIGGTKLQIATGNPDTGKIENLFRFKVEKEKGAAGILQKIEEALSELDQEPTAIGVGFGGPINRKSGIIATSHQIDGWSGLNLKSWFLERYRAKVVVENDANTAALGEAVYGGGTGYNHVFYVTLGSGVGGGMVAHGTLYKGNQPGEAEIGLMNLDGKGNTLESFCSGWALDKRIRKILPSLPNHCRLKQIVGEIKTGEAQFLLPAIQQDDEDAKKILNDYANNLAWGLSHIVHLFNPEVIVLGGGVSLIGAPLEIAIKAILPNFLIDAFRPGPEIKISTLK
jgi:glucokinase